MVSQIFMRRRLVVALAMTAGALLAGGGCGTVAPTALPPDAGGAPPGDAPSGCPQHAPSPATLQMTDPLAGEHFGFAIAADHDTVAVGAKDSRRAGPDAAGAVAVFERHDDTWSAGVPIVAADPAVGDNFGFSVALSGDVLAVGAPFSTVAGVQTGAVYLFARAADASWQEVAKLGSPTGGGLDLFGLSVAIDNGRLVVGATAAGDIRQGLVFVYTLDGARPQLEATLQPGDAVSGMRFGSAVAIADSRILIGAPSDSQQAQAAGAAYVFERGTQGWRATAKLVVDDPARADFLGFSLALTQNTAAIGAYTKLNAEGRAVGAVYVFGNYVSGTSDSRWLQQQKIVAADGTSGDAFGISVAMRGGLLAIGATGVDATSTDAGAIYLFRATGGVWQPQAELHAAAPSENAAYGQAVALSDRGFVATGASQTSTTAVLAGSAELQPLPCPAP
ncbi:MAG TPA: hypothetical protein VFP84_07985 [Kofleriaceae bacterium]|nr:hypothetical protein [Kofleriaceae bacterium]